MKGSKLGLVLTSPHRYSIEKEVRCGFKATNNEAEHEALIARLNLAIEMKIRKIHIYSDSQLIVN